MPQTAACASRDRCIRLGDVYKQLNASFGAFAMDTLKASTKALASGSTGRRRTYNAIETQIESLTAQRDTSPVRSRRRSQGGLRRPGIDEQQAQGWIDQAQALIDQAASLAAS